MTAPFLFTPLFRQFDSAGLPAAGYLLYTFAAGSTTPKATYSDAAGTVPNTNPVVMDTTGAATIRLGTGSYNLVFKDPTGVTTIWSEDDYQSPDPADIALVLYPQTPAESAALVTPTNTAFATGSFYRYGAKGGAGRVADAVIAGAVLTSASNGFAGAVAGMVCVVVDGGYSRAGGRPAPWITTILSVESATHITLAAPVIQPATITMTGTLNNNTFVTSTSLNPITAGVGLTRNWAITGTNIPANTTVTATNPTSLALSAAATGAGVVTVTLTAPIEVCFGFDDGAAINTALSLPYAITDVKDTFLTTQPLGFAAAALGGTGCNNFNMPSALFLGAFSNNAAACMSAAGLDRTNVVNYLAGIRYLPFTVIWGEFDCCNTGLGGFSLGPSNFSVVRGRITNPFRSALEEFFLNGGWQEGNTVDISCGRVGLHFHHKVSKSVTYQTLGNYRIQGRSPGLNSVYLGINATTQPDQCGGAVRVYAGGGATADGGISQNNWGMIGSCEFDGQRSVALSFGSDISNNACTWGVDVSAVGGYVIEGARPVAYSNTYRSNVFGLIVTEDISQASDTRGGYQHYAAPNTTFQSNNLLAPSSGPWGQTIYNPAVWEAAGVDNYVRYVNAIAFTGSLQVGAAGINGNSPITPQAGWGTPTAGAPISNYNGASATLVQTSNALSSIISQLKAFGLLST